MPAQELNDEMRQAIQAIQLRGYVNPKKFFKKNELTKMPKFFQVRILFNLSQIGTVIEGSTDFKDKRLSKKERKPQIIDEIIAEDERLNYTKKKYNEIQAEREALRKKKYIMKRAIKKNKSRRKNK